MIFISAAVFVIARILEAHQWMNSYSNTGVYPCCEILLGNKQRIKDKHPERHIFHLCGLLSGQTQTQKIQWWMLAGWVRYEDINSHRA